MLEKMVPKHYPLVMTTTNTRWTYAGIMEEALQQPPRTTSTAHVSGSVDFLRALFGSMAHDKTFCNMDLVSCPTRTRPLAWSVLNDQLLRPLYYHDLLPHNMDALRRKKTFIFSSWNHWTGMASLLNALHHGATLMLPSPAKPMFQNSLDHALMHAHLTLPEVLYIGVQDVPFLLSHVKRLPQSCCKQILFGEPLQKVVVICNASETQHEETCRHFEDQLCIEVVKAKVNKPSTLAVCTPYGHLEIV